MMNEFFSFQPRKYLLSMVSGEQRVLQNNVCKYATIKSTATQLKIAGFGEWKVSKKGLDTQTRIVRVK